MASLQSGGAMRVCWQGLKYPYGASKETGQKLRSARAQAGATVFRLVLGPLFGHARRRAFSQGAGLPLLALLEGTRLRNEGAFRGEDREGAKARKHESGWSMAHCI